MAFPTTIRQVTTTLPSVLDVGPQESALQVVLDTVTDGITAQHTSPSQSTAVLLTTVNSRVTTVTTANDAVRLPPAIAGLKMVISNAATNN